MEVNTEATATEQTAAYTQSKPLAQQIKDYLEATGTKVAALAEEIPDYSRPAVSRYLAGKYTGNITAIEQRLAEWLARRTGKDVEIPERPDKTGERPRFYESRDAKAVLGVCQSCQEHIGLGIVVGRSGYGKTHTLKEYAKLPRVAYIECDSAMGNRDLMEAIERSLGLPRGYGSVAQRLNAIRDFFNASKGYLLIVDEADKLINKSSWKKLDTIRDIFDKSSVGVVIAGEPKLEPMIKTYLDRMANRIGLYAKLNGLTPSEVEEYLSDIAVDQDALVELKDRACNIRTGCFRLLDRTLTNVERILQMRGEEAVTQKVLEQASAMMML